VDTWPSTIGQGRASVHPAAGRATAPPVPAQLPRADPEDLPSAGSPPAGGSGPVYSG